jgi:hypothetical protein
VFIAAGAVMAPKKKAVSSKSDKVGDLAEYNRKRDFKKTTEPAGGTVKDRPAACSWCKSTRPHACTTISGLSTTAC